MDELEQIVSEPRTAVIHGIEVDVSPLRVREIPPFSRALKPLLPYINNAITDMDAASIVELMSEGEHLIEAVSVATRQSADWVSDLDADEFVVLALKVLEVNADFFARRLMPSVAAQMGQAVEALGGTPASDSSTVGIQDG